jgi:hypothetical protein
MEQTTKTQLINLVRQNETLNKEILNAPEPSLLNLFSKTKINKKKELIENQQKIKNISNSYKRVLMTRIKNDEKVVNAMKDSPNGLRKATADWNETMNFVQSEMALFEKYLDLIPKSQVQLTPSSSTTLPMEDVISLDRMSEHRQQVKLSKLKSDRSIAQNIKDIKNISEIKKSKNLSRLFKYRLNNFEYVVIINGFFKGQKASIQNYNSVNKILNVKTVMNNKIIPLDSSEYLFIIDINSDSDDNYVSPKFVNHNSQFSGYKPYKGNETLENRFSSITMDDMEDEPYYSPPSPTSYSDYDTKNDKDDEDDEDDDLDNKSDFGYEEDEDTEEPEIFEMQTTFEQDVMAARNISNESSTSIKIKYAKIISEILQLLKINEDNVNPYELADTAIYTYSKYNVKDIVQTSSFQLKVFLAAIVYTRLNGTSLIPYEVIDCKKFGSRSRVQFDWSTLDYMSCVLEHTFFDKNRSVNPETSSHIQKMLDLIKFTPAPVSNFTPKKTLKKEQILYPVSQKREPFKQPERDISLRRGGPGKTKFIDLDAVAGKSSNKRRRSEFTNVSEKKIKTLKVPPPRSLESRMGKLTIDSPECSDCGLDRYHRDDTRQQKWKSIVCAKNCPKHSISKPSTFSTSSTSSSSSVNYSNMNLTDLKKIAKSKNVINFSKMKKPELIKVLERI